MAQHIDPSGFDFSFSYKSGNPFVEWYVDRVRASLVARGLRVFDFRKDRIQQLGKDIAEDARQTYGFNANFVVMFISEGYGEGGYTLQEAVTAADHARGIDREFILPFRFDNTKVECLPTGVNYAHIDIYPQPEDFAQALATKHYSDRVASQELTFVETRISPDLAAVFRRLGTLTLRHIRDGAEGLVAPYLKNIDYLFEDRAGSSLILEWQRFATMGTQWKCFITPTSHSPTPTRIVESLEALNMRNVYWEKANISVPHRIWFLFPEPDDDYAVTSEGYRNQHLAAGIDLVVAQQGKVLSKRRTGLFS